MAKERHREKERQKGRNTQPPFNPSVGSLCHFCVTPTQISYRFSIFETSATALCGTTGICVEWKSFHTTEILNSQSYNHRQYWNGMFRILQYTTHSGDPNFFSPCSLLQRGSPHCCGDDLHLAHGATELLLHVHSSGRQQGPHLYPRQRWSLPFHLQWTAEDIMAMLPI